MASKTQIANLGLAEAREVLINGDIDTSTQAIAETARLVYDQSLEQVLRRVRPTFAQTRTTLTKDATAPAFKYAYAYELPVNYVYLIAFNGEELGRSDDKFEIEGRKILTDEDEANIVYIKKEEDTSLYTPEFIQALSLYIGYKVLRAKRGDRGLADDLKRDAMMAVSEARAADMNTRKVWNQRDIVRYNSRWSNNTRRISTNDSIGELSS